MDADGLTSTTGSPGHGCVTGAPELQLRTPALRTRRTTRDTGWAAIEACRWCKIPQGSRFGRTLARDSPPPGPRGRGGAGAGPEQPIGVGAVPRGFLGVVVHSRRSFSLAGCVLSKEGLENARFKLSKRS